MDDKSTKINKEWIIKNEKNLLFRWICVLLALTISVLPAATVQAKKSKNYWPKLSDEITAGAAILMDVDTGTILYKKILIRYIILQALPKY
ncbi:hypothetical protein C823_005615 [Eubacterium plexicaudatum ASF492]|nr:hypothetical protein C823_005615 [Eubacterium plexicaudatum ASF492]